MAFYDLIISASCYYSPLHAARLIQSAKNISGNVLPIITFPRQEDMDAVYDLVKDENCNALLLKSERAERHLCQDLGFLFFKASGFKADYVMFADDDIEFVKPELLRYLEDAVDFGAFGFSSSTTHYGSNPFQGKSQSYNYVLNPIWIDGHNLTVRWDHIFDYGLFDALPGNFNSSFVEVEITHRYRALGALPAIGCKYAPIIHHSRVNNVEQIRDQHNQQSVVHCGYRLWEQKFGLAMSAGDFNSGKIGWEDIYNTLNTPEHREQYKRHLILDGYWIDYDAAWKKFIFTISKFIYLKEA